ncbi:MAG: hypothetical protein K8R77_13235 [Anaerolineaceae bacterium]|nr:hypothetical protein [Anaerolineaceae bacterium]
MAKEDKVKAAKLEIGLPFDLGKITLVPDDAQKNAAWELYVELTTRIAVQELKDDEGLVREALTSLYRLFDITRGILRAAGPGVAKGPNSLGKVAIDVLNVGLRPFLAKWHPTLQTYEAQRPDGVSPREHEDAWERIGEVRQELEALRQELAIYADVLAKIAGIELTQSD